jgi:hypothetical protein
MAKIGRFFLPVLCAATLAASDPALATEDAPDTWQVEVHVYSGRPNPVFDLNPTEAERTKTLLSRAQSLPNEEARTTIFPAILGYRGLSIRQANASGRIISEAKVYGQKVLPLGEAESARPISQSASLERYLLVLAARKGAISTKMYRRIRNSERKD